MVPGKLVAAKKLRKSFEIQIQYVFLPALVDFG
jgi:hypothetical protein